MNKQIIPGVSKMKKAGKTRKSKLSQSDKNVRALILCNQSKQFGKMQVSRFPPGFGFPDKLECVLRYNTTLKFSGVTTGTAQVWRMNSLFDPDLTGTGHQPQQFDQLSAVYSQYCVIASQVKMQIMDTSTNAGAMVGLYSDKDNSANTTENLKEGRWAKFLDFSANAGINRLSLNFPPVDHSMIHGQKLLDSDPNNYQAVTTNPTDVVFFIVKCSSIDLIASADIFVNFDLTFNCIFKELTVNTESLVERVSRNNLAFVSRKRSSSITPGSHNLSSNVSYVK